MRARTRACVCNLTFLKMYNHPKYRKQLWVPIFNNDPFLKWVITVSLCPLDSYNRPKL